MLTRERQQWMDNTIDFFRSLCLNCPNANGVGGIVVFEGDEVAMNDVYSFKFIYRGKEFNAALELSAISDYWRFEIRSGSDVIETIGREWYVNIAENDEYFYRNNPVPAGRHKFNRLEDAMEFFYPIHGCAFDVSRELMEDDYLDEWMGVF